MENVQIYLNCHKGIQKVGNSLFFALGPQDKRCPGSPTYELVESIDVKIKGL